LSFLQCAAGVKASPLDAATTVKAAHGL